MFSCTVRQYYEGQSEVEFVSDVADGVDMDQYLRSGKCFDKNL